MSAARSGSAARARATSRSRTWRGGSSAGGEREQSQRLGSGDRLGRPRTGPGQGGRLLHHQRRLLALPAGHQLVAQPQQHDGGAGLHALGDPAAGAPQDRRVAVRGVDVVDRQRPPEQRLREHRDEGMAALHGTAPRGGGIREVDGDRARDVLGGQALADLGRQRRGRHLESPAERFEAGAEPGEGPAREAPHVVAAADGGEALAPLGQHLLGLDAPLREHRPVLFRLRLDVLPFALEQLKLAALVDGDAASPPQEHGLEQRLRERVALVGHRHRNAELFPDARRLAQDDLEHCAVHRVVAVEERRAHGPARLAEAVDTTLALLVTRRVPREIVVNDGIELLLQVDAFRQAVGGDKNPGALRRTELRHAPLALLGGHLAGHGVDGGARQARAEVAGHVARRRDEATEDHHVEPVLDQLRDLPRYSPELRVAPLAGEPLRLLDEPCQCRAVAARRGLDVVRDQRVGLAVENATEKVLAGLVVEILARAGSQGEHGRGGARRRTAKERQRSPEVQTLPPLVAAPRLDRLGAVIEDIVEERLPGAAELVRHFLRFAAREDVAVAPLGDVGTPPLDEVAREAFAKPRALRARDFRQALEVAGEQAQQPVEGSVIAAVRRGGEHHEMPRRAVGQPPEQLVPLMPAPAGRNAGVRLVDNHEVGARLEKVVAPLPGLDVVETDDGVRVHREDAHAGRNAPFQTARAPGGDGYRADVEANVELRDPLVHQVRRAEDDGALDVAAVEQLARDEQGFDGLADPDVVGDEQAHRVELERHEQRHELVGARLDRNLSEAPKRPRAPPQREQQRIAKQQGRVVPAQLIRAGQREPRLADRLDLERQVDQRPIFLRSRDGANPQRLGRASAEDDPLPPASADEAAGREGDVAHDACPRTEASRANAARQAAGSSNRTTSKPRSSNAWRAERSPSSMTAAA